MRHYEVTFIVDPVLSGDEIKATAKTYQDMISAEGCQMVNTDDLGLRQLAYPINKRSSGVYYCIEFNQAPGDLIPKLELALTRDERIMRYLTVKLDKYGVKYNEDKRQGKIGKIEKKAKEEKDNKNSRGRGSRGRSQDRGPKPKVQEAKPVTPPKSEEE